MNVNPLLKVLFIYFTKTYLIFLNKIFLFTTYKNISNFSQQSLYFYPLQKHIWFLQSNPIFLTYKNIYDFYEPNLFFFFNLQKQIWILPIKSHFF